MSQYYSHRYMNNRAAKSQPSKHARQLVHDAFDADKLIDICVRDDFSAYAERVELPAWREGDERFYWYKDNGADILAIAHLDTVQEDRTCRVVETASGLLAVSGGLDDRLGAYVILELLPKLGLTVDWLLTTDEEMGQSTGYDFVADANKDYNWMFQFDRAGTDVVMYDYETPELVELVEKAGSQVGRGSYSDISDLGELGCAGFNWGVGYQQYHEPRSHAWLDDTLRSVARFVKFHRANAEKVFAYDPPARTKWGSPVLPLDDADDEFESYSYLSADCGHIVNLSDKTDWAEIDNLIVCMDCFLARQPVREQIAQAEANVAAYQAALTDGEPEAKSA